MSGSSGRKPLVAGNWKMHNNHLEALALTQQLAFRLNDKDFAAADIVVLPPFTALRSVQTLVQGDKLKLQYGAQDVSPHADGAYTGDISGRMLAKLGCRYVLAGHSERRQYHHEGDELINAKVRATFANEMTPVLCVGESLTIREAGEHVPHCSDQVDAGLAGLTGEQVAGMVIAYEPIWAIGTGQVATPEDAEEVCGGDQGASFRSPWARSSSQSAYPLRGISEPRQHACHHGAARHRRRARRRCQPRLRRIRENLSLSAGPMTS